MEMSGNSRFNGEDHALEISRNPCKEAIGNENVSVSLCIYLLGFVFVFAGLLNSHLVSAGWKWLATKPNRHVSGRTTESTPWSGVWSRHFDSSFFWVKKRLRKTLPNDTSSRHGWNWFSIFFSNILKSQWYDFPASPKKLLSHDQFKPTWKWGENKTFLDLGFTSSHFCSPRNFASLQMFFV